MTFSETNAMRRVRVRATSGRYDVLCGRGALARAGREVLRLGPNTGVFLLSSPRVWRHWGRALRRSFRSTGGCTTILFDDRETAKRLATVERVCRALVRAGADRRSVLVAAGGGVVGDVAGFVAATYLRGVRLVHLPTTLVAQVDSAVGGKTGVNLPEGKNLVGAFYQPSLVLADPGMLTSLTPRQFRSGLYEVIKYGVIGDPALFDFLERNLGALLRRRPAGLSQVVPRCIRAKAEVVRRDERESGPREVLNFGHTLGHALETVTGYRKFLHGEAVGWGMIAAAQLGVEVRVLDPRAASRIMRIVREVGPLPALPRVTGARILAAMQADKKARGGRLRFVLPRRIGRVISIAGPPDRLVRKVWAGLADAAKRAAPAR